MLNQCFFMPLKYTIIAFSWLFQYHTWQFTPQVEDKHVMKPALIVWGRGQSSTTSGGKKRQFTLRAIGEGCVGALNVSKALNGGIL